MVRVYKKGRFWIGESHRYARSGNEPVWKKNTTKGYLTKKGSGMVISKSKSRTFVIKKLRRKGYDIR